MKSAEILDQAFESITSKRLIKTVSLLEQAVDKISDPVISVELDDIRQTAKAMFHYMSANADDPGRKKLYSGLLARTYRVYANMDLIWKATERDFYSALRRIIYKFNCSGDFIKTVLETYVSDLAMLSLEPDSDKVQQKKNDIYTRHGDFMEKLFAAIVTSFGWSDELRDFWIEIVLSPTTDSNDALLITSSITIGAITEFDANKTIALADIYAKATDTALRQRALTGFVLSFDDRVLPLFPELKNKVREVASLPGAAHEMLELQKQIFYCLNAERDMKKIRDEIMPGLTGNAPYRINGNGMIEEKETDRLQEILHPDDDDRATEEIEKSIQKITDMQQQGADIYFGGFSHMKLFPFFSRVSNWFLPYFPDQPDVAKARKDMGNGKLADILLAKSTFCESDKYSLIFALASVYNRLSPTLREMITSADNIGIDIPEEEAKSPAYVRRQYLQDLYRFFKLHPLHNDLDSPFDNENKKMFLVSEAFSVPEIQKLLPSLAVFLHDQKRHKEMLSVLRNFSKKQRDTLTFHLLLASHYSHNGDYDLAVHAYSEALKKAPDNEMALKGAARSGMLDSEFDMAAEAYGKLLEKYPGHKTYLVNRALAMIGIEDYDEAAKALYEADYRYPDDNSVLRVKAWLLMHRQKSEEAMELYRRITVDGGLPEDYLNMGYAFWAVNDYGGAAKAFKTFKDKKDGVDLHREFENDKELLKSYGILDDDFCIMVDLVDNDQ